MQELEATAVEMSNAIRHRGPDDAGTWADPNHGVALAHRRLAIVELSAAGQQPMRSDSGRFVLIFNGEIYNHLEIRAELERRAGNPIPWRGHSDTETLLQGFECWGVGKTLSRTVGMFALAVWDQRECRLELARDRFGEKPLYYGWSGGCFLFGSELKAIRAFPGFQSAVSRTAVAEYLRFLYIPAPLSIYEHMYKLEPGCLLTISGKAPTAPPSAPLRPGASYGTLRIEQWWSLEAAAQGGASSRLSSEDEALEALQAQLAEAVKLQSRADVPLGAFLSGGVDSSAIVALMQQHASSPVRTFTIAFEDRDYDESPHAAAVARHLGTKHTELLVTSEDAQAVIPLLPVVYDEPFADSSQIPTYLVCHAARQHVKVALSGDAGDELFGGYNRYLWAPAVWRRIGWAPNRVRHGIAEAIRRVQPRTWDRVGSAINAVRPANRGLVRLGEKAHKLGTRLAGANNLSDLYGRLVSEWQENEIPLCDASELKPWLGSLHTPIPPGLADSDIDRMMYWDSLTYLPDDILCKVDRASMAVSLETRAPFLDHRVAELAWRLPPMMKVRGTVGKWALRQVLYRHVPRELIERPKSGFAIPLGDWLRGPLKAWAGELLNEHRLQEEGYIDPAPITIAWTQHQSGAYDWTAKLWAVLMFQAWLEANK